MSIDQTVSSSQITRVAQRLSVDNGAAGADPVFARSGAATTPDANDRVDANDRAFLQVAAGAALLALAALMVGGTAMALTARTGTSTAGCSPCWQAPQPSWATSSGYLDG